MMDTEDLKTEGTGERDRRREKALAALLISLCLIGGVGLYLSTLNGGFLADDYWYMDQAQTVSVLAHPFEALRKGNFYYFRPLPSLWWSALYDAFGFKAPLYRISSIFLHMLATLSVLLLGRRVLKNLPAAAFAAWFFAVNPLHAEAVAWVSCNADIFAALFFCLSLERYLKWRDAQTGGRGALLGSAFFGVLALLSKESAYVLPLVMIAAELLPGANRDRRKRVYVLIAALVVVGCMFMVKTMLGAFQLRPPTGASPLSLFPANMASALIRFVAPAASTRAALPLNIAWMVALALLVVWAIARKAEFRRVGFGLCLLLIALVPPSLVSGIGQNLEFSRTLYLPSIGFVLVLAALLTPVGDVEKEKLKSRLWKWVVLLSTAIFIFGSMFIATSNLQPWIQAGRASNYLQASFKEAAKNFKIDQSALVEGVPIVIDGVPFHSNSYTLSVAMSIAGFPEQFKARGYNDRARLPFLIVSEDTPAIEAKMIHIQKLRLLKKGRFQPEYVLKWDSSWSTSKDKK